MTDRSLPLDLKIQNASITIGTGNKKTNSIVLEMTNHSDTGVKFSGIGSHGELTLSFSIGTEAEDLIGTVEQSANLIIDAPKDWKDKIYKKVSGQAVWTLRLSRNVFQPRESKTISLHDFASCTAPGQANLKIGISISGYEQFEKTLQIEKKAGVFQLLYFEADPPYIATKKDKGAFTLKWKTINAGKVVLYKNNNDNILKTFTAGVDGYENGKEFIYQEDVPDFNGTVYILEATDKGDQDRRQKSITISKLQSGWHQMSDFSRYGSPAVLFNRDKIDLHGIFIKDGKASLYSSNDPWAVWNLENETVPDKMETSPGVYFNKQLWLVGGSRSDPDNCSNEIWTYDVEKDQWQEEQPANWSARMGHACIVFQKKLWLMGGMDEAGNALKDVHSMDLDGSWQKHDNPPWDPRCMFSATVFEDEIWIYGGCAEPFADPLIDMWTTADGAKWKLYTKVPTLGGSTCKPISSALQVVKGELNLMGSFRNGTTVEACLFILGNYQKWSKRVVDIPWDKEEPLQNTDHALSAVSFKGLVFVHSLSYEIDHNPTSLVLYVP